MLFEDKNLKKRLRELAAESRTIIKPIDLSSLETINSELRKMENRLEAEMRKFEAMCKSSPEGIVMANQKGDILFANQAAADIFGYEKSEMETLSVSDLIPDRFRSAHKKAVWEVNSIFESIPRNEDLVEWLNRSGHPIGSNRPIYIGKRALFDGVRKNGDLFPCEVSLTVWRENGTVVFGAHLRDVNSLPTIIDSSTYVDIREEIRKLLKREESSRSELVQSLRRIVDG